MLAQKFFSAARAINYTQGTALNAIALRRSIQTSSIVQFRHAPPVSGLNDIEGVEYDPKQESLESFLNIRFGNNFPTINDDKNPNRDLTNFPRPVQADFGDPTRLGIFPESWFQSFYNKTGVTGPYVFLGTFGTFLLSKEWLVFEHELLVGIQVTIILVAGIKILGPGIREKIGAKVDANLKDWDDWQQGMIQFLNDFIQSEKNIRDSPANHKILFDAKRQNIALQLEAEYRRRQVQAHSEVLRRLNFLVAKEESMKQFQQKHMVDWIISNVAKSITPQQEKETLKSTLAELKKLASKSTI